MSNSRLLWIVVIVTIGGIGLVSVLWSMAVSSQYTGGGFERRFILSKPLQPSRSLELRYNSYYLAGGTTHGIYLGNLVSPVSILHVDGLSFDSVSSRMVLIDEVGSRYKALSVKVDSPSVYIFDGRIPLLFVGDINSQKAKRRDLGRHYFLDLRTPRLCFSSRCGRRANLGLEP